MSAIQPAGGRNYFENLQARNISFSMKLSTKSTDKLHTRARCNRESKQNDVFHYVNGLRNYGNENQDSHFFSSQAPLMG